MLPPLVVVWVAATSTTDRSSCAYLSPRVSGGFFILALRRWWKEFTEFFFQKGNALNLAIAVVVGTQFQQFVDALAKDLLMPLLNPLIRNGGWGKWVIPYAGGELLIGQAMNVLLNSLIVGWALSLIVKAINRSQRMASVGLDQVRGRQKAEVKV